MPKTKKVTLAPRALLPEEMADSTREQQEAHVRTTGRRCRGKLMFEHAAEQKTFKAWYELQTQGGDKGARKMIGNLAIAARMVAAPGVPVTVPPLPEEEGNWYRLRQIAFPLIRLRGERVGHPCGADHNDLIVAEKFDGADHVVPCPGCGTPVDFKSPVFY